MFKSWVQILQCDFLETYHVVFVVHDVIRSMLAARANSGKIDLYSHSCQPKTFFLISTEFSLHNFVRSQSSLAALHLIMLLLFSHCFLQGTVFRPPSWVSTSEVQSKMIFMGHQILSCHVLVVRSFFIL